MKYLQMFEGDITNRSPKFKPKPIADYIYATYFSTRFDTRTPDIKEDKNNSNHLKISVRNKNLNLRKSDFAKLIEIEDVLTPLCVYDGYQLYIEGNWYVFNLELRDNIVKSIKQSERYLDWFKRATDDHKEWSEMQKLQKAMKKYNL
jgi:hypothetical protein